MERKKWNLTGIMCMVCAGIVVISYPLSIWCQLQADKVLTTGPYQTQIVDIESTEWAIWNGASKAAMCAYLAFYILIPLCLRKFTAPEHKLMNLAKACLFDLGVGCVSFLLGLVFLYQIDFVGVYYVPLVYETAATVVIYLLLVVRDKVLERRSRGEQ